MRLRHAQDHSPAWVLAESVSTALLSLASMLLVGRAIGPEAMGAATIALAAFLILDVLCAALFTDALVQHPRLSSRHIGSATAVALLVGFVAAAALVLLAPVLATVTGIPEVIALTLALAPLLPLSAWSGAAAGPLLRAQRFRLLAARALVGQPLALACALGLAQAGYGPWAMIVSQMTLTVITLALIAAWGRPTAPLALNRAALAELWPVALPQIGAVAVLVGRYRLFLLAVGIAAGQSVVAVSHVAFRLLDGVLVVVFQTISRVGLPRLCAAVPLGRAPLAQAFGDMAELQALMGLPVSVGVALVAPQMVEALLGPDWAGAAEAAQVVGLSAALGFLLGDPNGLFTALGRTRVNLAAALASLALPLLLLVVLRPQSAMEVALCWASSSLLLPPVLAALSLRAIGRSPLWLLCRGVPALAATSAMAVAVLALQAAAPMRAGLALLASAALGSTVYLAVAALALGFRRPAALRSQALPTFAEDSAAAHPVATL